MEISDEQPSGSKQPSVSQAPLEEDDDPIVQSIPLRLCYALAPNLHLHQFPLLRRPPQVPPSAQSSGKRIKARYKPEVGRYEIHVPIDARPDVWNMDRAKEYGAARAEEDKEVKEVKVKSSLKGKGKAKQTKLEDEEDADMDMDDRASTRLKETRLRSEKIAHQGVHFVGVLRDGEMHLHPISETYQFRPAMTYLDLLSKKTAPTVGDEEEEEEEAQAVKVGLATPATAKEIVVSARDATAGASVGGLSALRRELISTLRKEQDAKWVDLEWHEQDDPVAEEAFEALFCQTDDILKMTTPLSDMLTSIKGLTQTGLPL